jgi:RHS repeat-associated protein
MPTDSRVLVAVSEGLGIFADPIDMTGVPTMTEQDRWELADINGDGAADLVRIGHRSADLWTNQHDGSFAASTSITWPDLAADETVILSDIDASGTIDLLRINPESTKPWQVWSFADHTGLLATLRTDLGYTRAFTYRPAAALAIDDASLNTPWSTTPPTPSPVLVQSDESDAHTAWTSTTRHHVRDGWYDPTRGEFRGFAEQRDEHPGDTWTESSTLIRHYDLGQQDEARKLQLLASETRSPRGPLTRELHTIAIDTPVPGVQAARRIATDTFHIEAGPEDTAARVRTEWDHDKFNNLLEERALGLVDLKTGADIPGDERITTNTYAEPTSPDAPRDRLAEQIVADADGTQITATRTYYDGDPEVGLPLGQLGSRGVVARTETWISGDQWTPTLRQTIDVHGNITRVRDAEGGTLTRRFDALGLFPIQERVALEDGALVTTATWDASSGQPTAVTSPSGATSTFIFDGLGRLTAEVLPGDTAELPTRRHSYHFTPGTRPAITTELRRISGQPDVERTTQHLDGLGRPLARITHDDSGNAAILAEAAIYSAAGQIAEQIEGQALPATALDPGAPITLASTWPRTRTERDALGRTTFERDPDNREQQTTFGPLWTEARDHEDLHPVPPYTDAPERSITDGLGRLIRFEQTLAGRTILHRYAHDAAGRLLAHTDPAGHISRYTRDGAGHLIAVDSPDAGHITQRFDLTGRITERITATGARITWAYDLAGRLRNETSYDPKGTPISAATLHYDHTDDPTALYEAGKLTAVDDDAGHTSFTHDTRGRVTETTRRFTTHSGDLTLSTRTEYDAQDRVLREFYPDGTPLEREYTARGLEAPLAGWTTAATRDARGRWTSLSLLPGLTLTRELDTTGRLHAQQLRRGDTKLLDLAHTHDIAGLLTETRDLLGPTPQTPALDQRFTHDDLHRLTFATGPYGQQSFTYSDDENLLTLAGAALNYGGPQPHAVTEARNQHFTYDAAGQLTNVTGDGPIKPGTWNFDPHGRLRSFTATDGARTQHIYDHAGKETIRREYDPAGTLAHETLYVSPSSEVRDGQLVRWIFWSGERIAESPTDIPRNDEPLPAAALLTGLLFLLLLRRLHAALTRLRLGTFAPLLRRAPALAVLALAALNCGDSPTTLQPDAHTRFHIADRLGSATLVLDHTGEVVARDLHAPYGTAAIAWRADHQPGPTYRFTGKEDNTLASAVSIGARQYIPALGRWASPDPQFLLDPEAQLARPGERNLYRYAANSPIQHLDPTGHGWITLTIKAVKASVKAIYKGYDKVDEFTGIANDIAVVADGGAGLGARAISGLSLATEAAPISANDFKSFVRWAREGRSMMGSVSSSVAKARRSVELRMSPTDAATAAHNAANSSRLRKQMASDEQFGELQTTTQSMAGKGGRVQIRDAPRLANTYGGSTDDWSKIRSSNYKDVDGTSFETHAYRNESTGQVVEPKTKFQ